MRSGGSLAGDVPVNPTLHNHANSRALPIFTQQPRHSISGHHGTLVPRRRELLSQPLLFILVIRQSKNRSRLGSRPQTKTATASSAANAVCLLLKLRLNAISRRLDYFRAGAEQRYRFRLLPLLDLFRGRRRRGRNDAGLPEVRQTDNGPEGQPRSRR